MATKTTDSYGSARWANAEDLEKENLFCLSPGNGDAAAFADATRRRNHISASRDNRALILGKMGNPAELMADIRSGYDSSTSSLLSGLANLFSSSKNQGNYLGWNGDGHVITIAPTRSGKGVGMVIPNLLHYPGSVIVIDPKGENYAVTAEYRRKVLHQQVVCLDPFHVITPKTNSINPLEGIVENLSNPATYLDQNPELGDVASNIADAMILRDARAGDPHWDDKARSLLKGLILAVLCGLGYRGRRHLSCVRELLAQPFDDLYSFIYVTMREDAYAAGGLLKRAANEILSAGENELKSIISCALKHTEFLDSQLLCEALGDCFNDCRGTYNISELKKRGAVSVYIIIPPHHLARYARAVRMWVTIAMAAMTQRPGLPADGCPVLFMLDEMAQLGTMEMMRQAVSLMAGYGMSIWMVWQDLAQLKALYEHDWATFLANAKIQQFFGINDHETARYVSEMLGAATIKVASKSMADNFKYFVFIKSKESCSKGVSESEITRNLLNPDEVRRLDRQAVLTFVQGVPPILSKRLTYYNDSHFAGKASPNPHFNRK